MWLWGFKILGNYPHEIKKKIVIVIPHTSNWDFPLGVLTKFAMPLDLNYVGKASLFKPPFGFFFRALGGVPVDRSKSNNYVASRVEEFRNRDAFTLVIAPEGTRKKVNRLRTGFYYIALQAGIPIIMCQFDWAKKEVVFREPFYPSGDWDADLLIIKDYFKDVQGKRPDAAIWYNPLS